MKKVVITGGGTGLGRALAHEYAENGNFVILVGRTPASLVTVSQEIETAGGKSVIATCDISDYQQDNRLAADLAEEHGKIDELINNAGFGAFDTLEILSVKDIDTMIDINVKGTIYLTKAMLPHLEGKIVNIVPTAGLRGKVKETVYCASKFAVRGFTDALAKELENTNISVTAAYMGGMNTPFWDESDYVEDPSVLKGPEVVAKQIFAEDDGRLEIFIDR